MLDTVGKEAGSGDGVLTCYRRLAGTGGRVCFLWIRIWMNSGLEWRVRGAVSRREDRALEDNLFIVGGLLG